MAESDGISGNLDSTLSVAYRNICNAQTPIRTLKDLSKIRGVGKWILRLMQGFPFFQESVADETSAKNDAPREESKRGEKIHTAEEYGSYALLITLYRAMQNGASYMKKQELIDASEASDLSRTQITTDKSKLLGSFGS